MNQKFSRLQGVFRIISKNTYNKIGIDYKFVQDNHSHSVRCATRTSFPEKKPTRKVSLMLKGAVYDVVVDINLNSKTFGKYLGVKLTKIIISKYGSLLALLMDSVYYLKP